MTDATHCPACGHVNALAAETCENCGEPLRPADTPLHPGETFRDPDDLSFPDGPPKKPSQRSMLPAGAWIRAEARAAARAEQAERDARAHQAEREAHRAATVRADTDVDSDSDAAALRVLAARMAARRREFAEARPSPATRPAHYAGFVVRAVAFVIDAAVLTLFTVPLTIAGIFGVRIGLIASGTPLAFIDTEEALGRMLGIAWLAMATISFT